MSFRRAVISSVMVQALGTSSAFLTVLLIGRLGGPSDQGQFAQYKAWVDFLAAVGCFGFPQGFLYVINRFGASAAALARWSRLYGLAFLPVALIGSAGAIWLGFLGVTPSTRTQAAVFLAVAAAILVLHGLWRGLYLTHDTGFRFAVFTILPAVTLLAACSTLLLTNWRRFDAALATSAVLSLICGTLLMRPVLREGRAGQGWREQPWPAILSNGLHAFLQAILATLQPLLAYGLVRLLGGEQRDVGLFNAGLFLLQGFGVPVGMVAPLLFARWTSASAQGVTRRLDRLTIRWIAAGAVAGGILAVVARPLILALFGPAYAAAVAPAQAMLLSLPLFCHVRLIAPAFHADGRPGVNTAAGAIRLVVFAVGGMLLPRVVASSLVGIGSAWTMAEVAGAAWTLGALRLSVAGPSPAAAGP